MDIYLLTAIMLIFILGLAHSVLGEILIFRHLRNDGRWIITGLNGLSPRRIRALWSTWHLLTLLAWSLATIFYFASTGFFHDFQALPGIIFKIIFVTFTIATPFWFIGTKGKHPAWIVFLIISILIGLAISPST